VGGEGKEKDGRRYYGSQTEVSLLIGDLDIVATVVNMYACQLRYCCYEIL
jgi:hypothetical protein